jgi:hypothetical protein
LTYPDGRHNAETLLVEPETGDIYIVTKDKARSRLYRAAAAKLRGNSPTVMELIAYLKVEDVSGGDISRAGDLVVLRKEDRGWIWSRRAGETLAAVLARAPSPVRVRSRDQGNNGEAVGFSPEGSSYFTASEGKNPTISRFPVPVGPAADAGSAGP